MTATNTPWYLRHPVVVMVLAQLFGTSLWFSVNGVALSLERETGLSDAGLGLLILAVQAGFITGTLLLAITGLADRFPASRLFAMAALSGAALNAAKKPGRCTSAGLFIQVLQAQSCREVTSSRW